MRRRRVFVLAALALTAGACGRVGEPALPGARAEVKILVAEPILRFVPPGAQVDQSFSFPAHDAMLAGGRVVSTAGRTLRIGGAFAPALRAFMAKAPTEGWTLERIACSLTDGTTEVDFAKNTSGRALTLALNAERISPSRVTLRVTTPYAAGAVRTAPPVSSPLAGAVAPGVSRHDPGCLDTARPAPEYPTDDRRWGPPRLCPLLSRAWPDARVAKTRAGCSADFAAGGLTVTAVLDGRAWALDQRFSASGDTDAFALAGPSAAMPGGFWLETATVDIVAGADSAGPLPEPALLALARRLRDAVARSGTVPG